MVEIKSITPIALLIEIRTLQYLATNPWNNKTLVAHALVNGTYVGVNRVVHDKLREAEILRIVKPILNAKFETLANLWDMGTTKVIFNTSQDSNYSDARRWKND